MPHPVVTKTNIMKTTLEEVAEAKGEVEAATEELTKAREESESAPTPDKKNRKKGNIEE